MATRREGNAESKHRDRQENAAGRGLPIAGFVVGVAGIVFAVLLAVVPVAAAMLLVGLAMGVIGGVLLAPNVGRAATWLSRHLQSPHD